MTTPDRVPPLCAGDRLTRDEFERRYGAMPDLRKAELVEGVVYMPSPVRWRQHGAPHAAATAWATFYTARTPVAEFAVDATLRLDQDNEPQPDIVVRLLGAAGRTRVDADGYLDGAPELVIEIAASSVSYDLHQKLEVYRRLGVVEYLVVRPADGAVDWFELRQGRYEPLAPVDGLLRSAVFPGLWLDAAALLRGDLGALQAAIGRGTATPEHAAFAQRHT